MEYYLCCMSEECLYLYLDGCMRGMQYILSFFLYKGSICPRTEGNHKKFDQFGYLQVLSSYLCPAFHN
jgi:hypothetical protein